MRGLRIIEEGGSGRQPVRDFERVLAALGDGCRASRWALSGTVVFVAQRNDLTLPRDVELEAYFNADSGAEGQLPPDRPVWELRWLAFEKLKALAPFVEGDWTQIIGFTGEHAPRRDEVRAEDSAWLTQNADVVFVCIDAVAWEFYSPDTDLLNRVRDAFPLSEPRVL